MYKKNKKNYLEHIACMVDLKSGTYLSVHNYIALAIFCFISGLLFNALVVALAVFESPWWILCGIILPLFYVGGIFVIIGRKKTRNKIFSFLNDAKEYIAQAVTENSQRELDINLLPTITRKTVRFEFDFNGERISKTVTGEQSPIFARYISRYTDREIRILYSPKYDFILILKDNAP